MVLAQAAGESALTKYRRDPVSTIQKIPRCMELLKFVISERYLNARRQMGLTLSQQGADR